MQLASLAQEKAKPAATKTDGAAAAESADGKGAGDDDGKGKGSAAVAGAVDPASGAAAAVTGDVASPITPTAASAAAAEEPSVVVPAPYSVRPMEYYQYHLVGILLHTGTAQAGHYYSFIKERTKDHNPHVSAAKSNAQSSSSPAAATGTEGRWLEFNDNLVRPFDVRRIEDECFGGEQVHVDSSWVCDACVPVLLLP